MVYGSCTTKTQSCITLCGCRPVSSARECDWSCGYLGYLLLHLIKLTSNTNVVFFGLCPKMALNFSLLIRMNEKLYRIYNDPCTMGYITILRLSVRILWSQNMSFFVQNCEFFLFTRVLHTKKTHSYPCPLLTCESCGHSGRNFFFSHSDFDLISTCPSFLVRFPCHSTFLKIKRERKKNTWQQDFHN